MHFKDSLLKGNLRFLKRNWDLYLFLVPGLIAVILFAYVPMYGIQLAFKDFLPVLGITGSPWAGFKHFERLFMSYQFWPILKNTLIINFYGLVWGFPVPIILALLLNQMKQESYRKFIQTVIYAPNFISVVVLVGMIKVFLAPRVGLLSHAVDFFGGTQSAWVALPQYFRTIYVGSAVWQTSGFGTVIYLAALSGVSPSLHEAAIVDGASKFRRILHIDLPSILPTIIILLLMSLGQALAVGFEKVFLLQSPLNLPVSEVISTYTYKVGLIDGDFGFATAVGLFNSVVSLILLTLFNKISRKATEVSLW